MADSLDFLRNALDPLRLAVLGRAAEGPVDIDGVASAMGASRRDVLTAVGRLREADLIDDELTLNRAVLRSIGSSLRQPVMPDPGLLAGPWSPEELEVLERFIQGRRLVSIPAQRAKRRVVLEWLAQEFVAGLRYPEQHVNATLRVFHDDHAALRRYLVDEGLLSRENGVYWRTGGRVDSTRDSEGDVRDTE